jgi:hypothetical protein
MSDGILDRVASRVLLAIAHTKWGVTAVIMPEIVATLGPFRAIKWMATNLPRYERDLAAMGGVRGHLVYTMASMLNGCPYCMYAHGRAFELHYFEERKRLFPLDEHQFLALLELPDAAAREQLEAALLEAGLDYEVRLVRRIYALKLEGAEPRADEDDPRLMHAIQMFDTLNRCAILSQAALDDAHDRINKDADLKARYADARLAQGKKPRPMRRDPGDVPPAA